MKRFYDEKAVESVIEGSGLRGELRGLPGRWFAAVYEPGEYLTSPMQEEALLQVVTEGSFDIYYIRGDGTRYALSGGGAGSLLGEMELLGLGGGSICAEATRRVTCAALSIDQERETLLGSAAVLRLIADSLAKKMSALTAMNAEPSSLEERVLTYMKYKCPGGVLKGMERAAFRLHCSERHLQRLMNRFEAEGRAEKTGKGCYRLISGGQAENR